MNTPRKDHVFVAYYVLITFFAAIQKHDPIIWPSVYSITHDQLVANRCRRILYSLFHWFQSNSMSKYRDSKILLRVAVEVIQCCLHSSQPSWIVQTRKRLRMAAIC